MFLCVSLPFRIAEQMHVVVRMLAANQSQLRHQAVECQILSGYGDKDIFTQGIHGCDDLVGFHFRTQTDLFELNLAVVQLVFHSFDEFSLFLVVGSGIQEDNVRLAELTQEMLIHFGIKI